MWRTRRITFHGHVELNLMTTATTLTQIEIYNFVYKFDSICSIVMKRIWVQVKFGLPSTTISWLTGDAAVVSGLPAVTYWLAVSGKCGPVAPKPNPSSDIADVETWISARFRSGFCFRSDFYIRSSGETTASPCVWPEDHGSGRFYAAYLARTYHYGCRISFQGRPLRSRLAATYVTWRCGFHDFT